MLSKERIDLMQSIGILHCKKCKGDCLPDIYTGYWVCQKCGTNYTFKTEELLEEK